MIDVPLANFDCVGRKQLFVALRLVGAALSHRRRALRLLPAAYPASAVEEFAPPAGRLVHVEGRPVSPGPPGAGAFLAAEAAWVIYRGECHPI